jgi:hypothetical protein
MSVVRECKKKRLKPPFLDARKETKQGFSAGSPIVKSPEFRCANCGGLVTPCRACGREFNGPTLALCEGAEWSLYGSDHYCNPSCYEKYVSDLADHIQRTVANLSSLVLKQPVETKILQEQTQGSAISVRNNARSG